VPFLKNTIHPEFWNESISPLIKSPIAPKFPLGKSIRTVVSGPSILPASDALFGIQILHLDEKFFLKENSSYMGTRKFFPDNSENGLFQKSSKEKETNGL
jgi:hypothetical protein